MSRIKESNVIQTGAAISSAGGGGGGTVTGIGSSTLTVGGTSTTPTINLPAFTTSLAFSVGQLCTYTPTGQSTPNLYKCIVAHSAGAWNDAHFQIVGSDQGLKYKGEVNIATNLPTTGQSVGDMYYVLGDNDFKVWNGTGWDTIDMPNPSTTGSSTFDIDAVGNTTQVNLNEFSATKTYPVGHIVTYQNQLYRCTTAITTAGAWNATNWTLIGTREGTPYCHFSVGGSEIPTFNNLFDGTLYNVNKSDLYIDSGTDFTTGMLVLNNGSNRIIGIITTISSTSVGILPLTTTRLSSGIQGSSIVSTFEMAGGGQPPAHLRLKSLNLGAIVSFTPYAEYANSQRSFIFKITRGLSTDPQPRLAISVLSLSNSTVDDFKVFIDPTVVNTNEHDFYVQASGSSGSSIAGILTTIGRIAGDNNAWDIIGSSSVPSGVIEVTKIDNTGGSVPPPAQVLYKYSLQFIANLDTSPTGNVSNLTELISNTSVANTDSLKRGDFVIDGGNNFFMITQVLSSTTFEVTQLSADINGHTNPVQGSFSTVVWVDKSRAPGYNDSRLPSLRNGSFATPYASLADVPTQSGMGGRTFVIVNDANNVVNIGSWSSSNFVWIGYGRNGDWMANEYETFRICGNANRFIGGKFGNLILGQYLGADGTTVITQSCNELYFQDCTIGQIATLSTPSSTPPKIGGKCLFDNCNFLSSGNSYGGYIRFDDVLFKGCIFAGYIPYAGYSWPSTDVTVQNSVFKDCIFTTTNTIEYPAGGPNKYMNLVLDSCRFVSPDINFGYPNDPAGTLDIINCSFPKAVHFRTKDSRTRSDPMGPYAVNVRNSSCRYLRLTRSATDMTWMADTYDLSGMQYEINADATGAPETDTEMLRVLPLCMHRKWKKSQVEQSANTDSSLVVWDYKGQGQADQTVLNDFYTDKTFTLLSVVGVTTFYNTSDTIAPKEGDLIRVGSGNGNAGLAVIPANTATWTATTASGVTTWKPDADMVCQLINHNAASSVKGFWALSGTNFPATSESFTMDFQTGTYQNTTITGRRGGNNFSSFMASGDLFMDAQGQIAIIDIADYTGMSIYNPRPKITATIVWTRYNVENSAPIKPPVRWFVNTKATIRDGTNSYGRWNGYVICPATNMTIYGGLGTNSNVSNGDRPKEGHHVVFADGTVVALSYVDSDASHWTVDTSAGSLTYTGSYTGSASIVQRPGLRKVIYVDSAYNGATGLNQNGVGSIFAPYKNLQAVIDNNDIITGAGQVIQLAAGTSTPAPDIPIAASNWTIQGDMAGQASRAEITTLMSIGGTADVNHVGIKGVQFSLTGGICVEINLNPDKTTYFENCNFKGDIDIRGDGFVSFTDCDVMGDIRLQGNVTVSLDRVQNENGIVTIPNGTNATLITKNCTALTLFVESGTHIEEGNSTYITSTGRGTDNDTYPLIYLNGCQLAYLQSGSAIDRNLQYLPIKIGENVEYFLGTFAFQNTADSQTSASVIDPAAIRLDGGLSSIQIIDRIQRSGYTLANGAVGYLKEHLDAISAALGNGFSKIIHDANTAAHNMRSYDIADGETVLVLIDDDNVYLTEFVDDLGISCPRGFMIISRRDRTTSQIASGIYVSYNQMARIIIEYPSISKAVILPDMQNITDQFVIKKGYDASDPDYYNDLDHNPYNLNMYGAGPGGLGVNMEFGIWTGYRFNHQNSSDSSTPIGGVTLETGLTTPGGATLIIDSGSTVPAKTGDTLVTFKDLPTASAGQSIWTTNIAGYSTWLTGPSPTIGYQMYKQISSMTRISGTNTTPQVGDLVLHKPTDEAFTLGWNWVVSSIESTTEVSIKCISVPTVYTPKRVNPSPISMIPDSSTTTVSSPIYLQDRTEVMIIVQYLDSGDINTKKSLFGFTLAYQPLPVNVSIPCTNDIGDACVVILQNTDYIAHVYGPGTNNSVRTMTIRIPAFYMINT